MLCASSSSSENNDKKDSYLPSLNNNNINIPKHVAFICDGNSRWAKQRNLPTSVGHVVGADRLVDLLEELQKDGVQYCTLYGFSTENWKRSTEEIKDIFRVMEQTARKVWHRVQNNPQVRIRLLGNLQDARIPMGLRTILEQLQSMTNDNNNDGDETLTVCLAVNYGGRQDILAATQTVARLVDQGALSVEDIDESTIEQYLSTAGIPDPDMIVRTSGECRLSNFLLWNCAYSEIYITNVLWPDFDYQAWKDALFWYQQRQRRFGSRSTTLPASSTTTHDNGTATMANATTTILQAAVPTRNGHSSSGTSRTTNHPA